MVLSKTQQFCPKTQENRQKNSRTLLKNSIVRWFLTLPPTGKPHKKKPVLGPAKAAQKGRPFVGDKAKAAVRIFTSSFATAGHNVSRLNFSKSFHKIISLCIRNFRKVKAPNNHLLPKHMYPTLKKQMQ